MATRQEIDSEITQTLGGVPGWLASYPDGQLEDAWGKLRWTMTDSKLSGRDKALISFGAAAAIHCPYCTPFHGAQFRLAGMGDEEIQEASSTAQMVAGFSAYLHGISYDVDKFKEELAGAVEHIKKNS